MLKVRRMSLLKLLHKVKKGGEFLMLKKSSWKNNLLMPKSIMPNNCKAKHPKLTGLHTTFYQGKMQDTENSFQACMQEFQKGFLN